ncbi:MAG: hypothetical protein U5L08_00845 [Xanthomonadales bacterium]|nr:hypothetical protein [Xanthomonadales bacterium]
MILLLGHMYVTVSGRLGDILNADFFPSRGFLFFALSGAAYGAAIFPQLILESNGATEGPSGFSRDWLVAIPAWIWLSILIGLAAIQYAS